MHLISNFVWTAFLSHLPFIPSGPLGLLVENVQSGQPRRLLKKQLGTVSRWGCYKAPGAKTYTQNPLFSMDNILYARPCKEAGVQANNFLPRKDRELQCGAGAIRFPQQIPSQTQQFLHNIFHSDITLLCRVFFLFQLKHNQKTL